MKIVWRYLIPYLIFLSIVVWLSASRFSVLPDQAYEGTELIAKTNHFFYGYNLERWDAGWYKQIVSLGYNQQSASFFPLYPILVSLVYVFIPDFSLIACILSLLFMLGGVWLFYSWVKDELDSEKLAIDSLDWLMFFPTSWFFFAPYTESLFFLLLMSVLWGRQKQKNWLVVGASFLLALTRLAGILIVIIFLADWWNGNPRDLRILLKRVSGAILGLGTYMVYLKITLGDAFAFVHSQSLWGRNNTLSFNTILDSWQKYIGEFYQVFSLNNLAPMITRLIDVLFFLGILWVVIMVYRRWRRDYAIWMLAMLALPLASGTLISMPRYVLPLPFTYVVLARFITNEWLKKWLQILFIIFWTMFLSMFVNSYWVA